MGCDGRKGGGEVKEIHGGGMKRGSRQFPERRKQTWRCVGTVPSRIRGDIKA